MRVAVVVAFFPPPPRARRNITRERTRTRARTRRTSASSPSRSRRARAPPSRHPTVASIGRSPTRPAGRGTKRRVMTHVGDSVSHPGCSAFVALSESPTASHDPRSVHDARSVHDMYKRPPSCVMTHTTHNKQHIPFRTIIYVLWVLKYVSTYLGFTTTPVPRVESVGGRANE